MAQRVQVSSKMPSSPTVKIDKKMFDDLWWVCRVEQVSPADVLKELAGVQIAARRKLYEAVIAKLVKSDELADQALSQVPERSK